jgi:hypothetical protein
MSTVGEGVAADGVERREGQVVLHAPSSGSEGRCEYTGQSDKGWARIKCEALLLDDVEFAACACILLKERDVIARACQPDRCAEAAQARAHYDCRWAGLTGG